MMNLAHPGYLWLFLLFIPLIAWYVWSQRKANPSMRMSSISAFKGLSTSWKVYVKHFSFVLKLAALSCLIIILCRPQTYDKWSMSDTEGTDIVMAIDISASMLSRDLQPDRLEAAKKVASDFVAKRESDNIGLVIFAGEGFTLLPMTTHQATLLNTIHEISINMLDADGTAIGDGIATAINRIKDGKAKSKPTAPTILAWWHRSPLPRLRRKRAFASTPSVLALVAQPKRHTHKASAANCSTSLCL